MHLKEPDYHTHEDFNLRVTKLHDLKELGIKPYPHHYAPTHTTEALQTQFNGSTIGHSDDAAAGSSPPACIAGRLVLFRAMGKNAFAQLQDESGRLQVMFNRELTQLEGYNPERYNPDETATEKLSPLKIIEKKIDLGDILGIEGHLFHTNKGELTLYAKKVTLLCKTLLPLPDKYAGLADKELRYRKRWLDLICNPEVKQTFLLRSQILKEIRHYFDQAKFLEVETPILQGIYGGAEARPFVTTLHALNQEMFMRIALEISLKKLVVGGLERVFEIGKVFRNEGIDRTHNPEFTMLEAYAAYWDYRDMMEFVEKLWEHLALKLTGKTQIPAFHPETGAVIEIEMKAPWIRLSMKDSLKKYANIEVDDLSNEEMQQIAIDSGYTEIKKLKTLSRGLLIGVLFEIKVEPHLIQPHHIIDHPIETTPFCKLHRCAKEQDEGLVERFESFVLCREVCNAYTELNDPEMQRKLLLQQASRRESGDEEASPLDEDFIEAICQGMPPAAGVGIGIDRLVMLFTNAQSIRDVLYFPWMKPQA